VLVMTSNAGASEISRSSIGFSSQDHTSDSLQVIKRQFAPEFRNRLDAIISFSPLDVDTIGLVVDKFIMELEEQLASKGVTLQVDATARDWLIEHGYDKSMGARPMARLIQEHVKKPLADELLFGKLSNGGRVLLKLKDGKLDFENLENREGVY
jgi:ATP-dependent Clp protease ATP-binding subunit ClpA